MPQKKPPNRKPNAECVRSAGPFYAAPSAKRVTCSMPCRTDYYRRIGNLLTEGRSGPDNHRWKGGRFLHQNQAYWMVLRPDHPHADRHGYVREHRLVMEAARFGFFFPVRLFHHRDGNGQNNALRTWNCLRRTVSTSAPSISGHKLSKRVRDVQRLPGKPDKPEP